MNRCGDGARLVAESKSGPNEAGNIESMRAHAVVLALLALLPLPGIPAL